MYRAWTYCNYYTRVKPSLGRVWSPGRLINRESEKTRNSYKKRKVKTMCKKKEENVTGGIKESTAQLSLKAAAYAIVDAAMGTEDHAIMLNAPEGEESFYIAVLQVPEMEDILKKREFLKKLGASNE